MPDDQENFDLEACEPVGTETERAELFGGRSARWHWGWKAALILAGVILGALAGWGIYDLQEWWAARPAPKPAEPTHIIIDKGGK